MNGTKDLLALVGRVLLAVMFVYSGYGKIGGFEGTAHAIAGKGLPLPEIGAAIALVVELIGGLMLAVGWKARWAAAVIVVFTAAATYFFHDFWQMADAGAHMTNQIMFFKNIAVIGGMLLVVAFGPGRLSLDRR
ncbi:MAG TPA: DoxX family protein [Casimicrobiaceae bacterium]|jgi:putative oxidoreductase|nr:DoxX family protein [Casimicrobiaceae bacterium]